MLQRNHDAMKGVLDDLRLLRKEVRNEADPSQAAREILRKKIESSSVRVLGAKAKAKKARATYTDTCTFIAPWQPYTIHLTVRNAAL